MISDSRNHGTVLVTGASSGIGRELAREFSACAHALVLVARRSDRLQGLRDELSTRYSRLQVVVLASDLSDEREIETLLGNVADQVGVIDVLVNNAGLGDSVLFDRSDWTRTRLVLRTNMMAMAHLASALVPAMVQRGRGGVLNIGPGAGLTVMPSAAAYVSSKHFVAGFSEALRADLAGTGVTVTQVCPGPVDSEFDQVSGSEGGMAGSPPQFIRISAARCAREARLGFERGQALVFPGTAYRIMMTMLPLVPMRMRRKQAAKVAVRPRASQPRRATANILILCTVWSNSCLVISKETATSVATAAVCDKAALGRSRPRVVMSKKGCPLHIPFRNARIHARGTGR